MSKGHIVKSVMGKTSDLIDYIMIGFTLFVLVIVFAAILCIPLPAQKPTTYMYRTASGVTGKSNSCGLFRSYRVPTCTLEDDKGIVVVESYWRVEE